MRMLDGKQQFDILSRAEREQRIEDDRVQQLIDDVVDTAVRYAAWTSDADIADKYGAPARAAEEALQEYIAGLRGKIEELERTDFFVPDDDIRRFLVLIVTNLVSAGIGAAVASALWLNWLGR